MIVFHVKESLQSTSIKQLQATDRASLLAEIRELRTNLSESRLSGQDGKQQLLDRLSTSEDEADRRERQLQRQGRCLEQ